MLLANTTENRSFVTFTTLQYAMDQNQTIHLKNKIEVYSSVRQKSNKYMGVNVFENNHKNKDILYYYHLDFIPDNTVSKGNTPVSSAL